MERTKLISLGKRTLSALVLVPLIIACLYAGYPFIQIFALIFGSMLAWEWSHMVPNCRGAFYATLYTVALGVAVLTGVSPVFWIFLFGAVILAWFKSREETRRNLLVLGVPYISIGIGSIVWLYELVGFYVTFWFFLIVWAMDTGGYIFGCAIGGPKLAPKVSPNKTWAGLAGGVALAVGVTAVFIYFVNASNHLLYYGLIAAVIAVIAQIGDLVESYIKRSLNLKDSSNLIPGHGGVFDRVDGLIFAAPFVFLLFGYVLFLI